MLMACGGGTYTTVFFVSVPASAEAEPTAVGRRDGTRLTITEVFFHTKTESSVYSVMLCFRRERGKGNGKMGNRVRWFCGRREV